MANKPSAPAMRAAVAIINSTVNPAQRHEAVNVTAPHLARIIEEQTSIGDLPRVTKTLMEKADGVISAIDGATGQFEPEVAALSSATSAAEKTLKAITEAQHGRSR
jgi:hypothetical protein